MHKGAFISSLVHVSTPPEDPPGVPGPALTWEGSVPSCSWAGALCPRSLLLLPDTPPAGGMAQGYERSRAAPWSQIRKGLDAGSPAFLTNARSPVLASTCPGRHGRGAAATGFQCFSGQSSHLCFFLTSSTGAAANVEVRSQGDKDKQLHVLTCPSAHAEVTHTAEESTQLYLLQLGNQFFQQLIWNKLCFYCPESPTHNKPTSGC